MEDKNQEELERARAQRGRIRLVVGLLIAVTAFYIFIAGATEGGVYFFEVDEALDQKADQVVGRMVRIKGHVVEGTWTQKMPRIRSMSFELRNWVREISRFLFITRVLPQTSSKRVGRLL